MCADIVVVGGGPVGLWTAIQAKKRNSSLDIQVYERYTEYERSHILKLEYFSMLLYSKKNRDTHEAEFYKSVTGKTSKEVYSKAAGAKSVFIRTNELEDALKVYAANLGICINYQKIDSLDEIEQKHPECKQFIAADGAHSNMRQALMGDNAVENFPLQYVVEVKYEANGTSKALSKSDQHRTNKMLSGLAFEYVGREKNGMTPTSLRFFVDQETYEALPEASFRNPLKLNNPDLPEKLKKDIQIYMNVRKEIAKEDYKEGSEKLSKLTLSLYKAKKFAIKHGTKNWYLVGDAAMGVPYFRSLNAGMIIGSQLGAIISQRFLNAQAKVFAYNAIRPLDTAWEFTAAKGKDTAIKLYDEFRKVSGKSILQVTKWNEEDKKYFVEKKHVAFHPKK